MPAPARGPAPRTAGGRTARAGTPSRPARPGARTERGAQRLRARATRTPVAGHLSTEGGGRAGPGAPGISVTTRAAVLALVVAVLAISYAYPLRAWLEQRSRAAELQADRVALETSVADLQARLDQWDDPAYVAAQARERLGFVVPGETGYVVVEAQRLAAEDTDVPGFADVGGAGPWWQRLWASVEEAGQQPGGPGGGSADVPPPVTPDQGAADDAGSVPAEEAATGGGGAE